MHKNMSTNCVTNGDYQLVPITIPVAESAADLRARYNLRTPDALHVASAIHVGCEAFLTNDTGIKRVQELAILILDELEL
jgi:predicted nucleic acid-binding protein